MRKENLNENEQLNQCHPELDSGSPKDCLRRRLSAQALNRDAECPQHDGIGCEGGRSMVEMLGVLAIIGVLTIIGITGFRYALNKHYANQTVQRLMRRAVVVAGQANFGQNLSLHEFDENDGEYPIPQTITSNTESFTLTVNEVPEAVCQQIVGLDWKLAKIIPADCSDTTMKFMFLNDLTDCTDCQPETFPCEDYGTECGKCSVVKGYTRNDDDCIDDNKRYCVMGRCEVCPAGQTIYNGSCKACLEINGYGLDTIDDCHRCVDANNNHTHFAPGGVCYKCTDTVYSTHDADTTLEECNLCQNRCFRKDIKRCGWPGHTNGHESFVEYVRNEQTGYCDCAEGYYFSRGEPNAPEICRTCDQINNVWTSVDACHACVNAQGQHTHFIQDRGACYKCTDTVYSRLYTTTLAECNLCENRCFASDNKCYIYGSGQTYTGKDDDGYCTQ